MRLARTLVFFLFLFISVKAVAQLPKSPNGVKQPRILILLDGSSSMLAQWDNKMPRFKAAGNLVSELMDSVYKVNNQVEFGLRVYGHQYPAQENVCTDTKREVMFSKDNYTQMALRIASLHPSGVSPIAYALKEAASNDLEDELNNAYSIILISDGGESCNGDVCETVRMLLERKIFFKSYVISLVDNIPERQKYTCLGDNIIAVKTSDITPAIQYIMKDYRPLLAKPIMVQPKPETPAHIPDIRTLNIPKTLFPKAEIQTLPVVLKDNVPQMFHYNPVLRPLRRPFMAMAKIEKDEDPVAITSTQPRVQPNISPVAPAIKTQKPIATTPIKKEPEMEVTITQKPAPTQSSAVPPVVATPVTQPVKQVKDTARTQVVIKPLPPVVPAVKNTPIKIDNNKPKDLPFTISAEDDKQTTLQIYFTDGHGKFYKTTPKLQLQDAKGAVVKQFYRTMDASGNPDPQDVPAGNYTLAIPGRSNARVKAISIQQNKKHKVVVVVGNSSLIFRYEGAPDRPVAEFDAMVNILFEPGPSVKQRCTAELEYAPGNYHIDINTLPPTRRNLDIDFNSTMVVSIPQPGFVQISNTNPVGKVSFYHELGDQFARFYIMELGGNPETQKLRLQPGTYEIHWVKNPAGAFGTETIQRFQVKSNAVTEIQLQ